MPSGPACVCAVPPFSLTLPIQARACVPTQYVCTYSACILESVRTRGSPDYLLTTFCAAQTCAARDSKTLERARRRTIRSPVLQYRWWCGHWKWRRLAIRGGPCSQPPRHLLGAPRQPVANTHTDTARPHRKTVMVSVCDGHKWWCAKLPCKAARIQAYSTPTHTSPGTATHMQRRPPPPPPLQSPPATIVALYRAEHITDLFVDLPSKIVVPALRRQYE